MKKSRQMLLHSIHFLLICLWVYAALSKLLDFNDFRVQMARQTLPHPLKNLLAYALPPIELIVAGLLCFRRTAYAGYWASLLLMTLFTGYVGLVLTGAFGRIPCSCGGVISTMGWKLHFLFNLFFLTLTCLSILIIHKAGGTKA